MKLLLYFTRAYPAQTAIVLVCLLFAGLLSGVGFSVVLPLLSLADNASSAAPSGYEARVLAAVDWLGIPPGTGPLIAVVMAAFLLKAAILLVANTRVGYTVAHVATDLRLRLLRALVAARWSFYTHLPVGQAANAVATEATRAARAYHQVALATSHAIEASVSASVALAVSWQITLLAAVAGAFTSAVLHVFVRMASRAGKKQTRLFQSLLGRLTDAFQSVKLLKATGREELVGRLIGDTQQLNRALQKQVVGSEALRTLQEPILVGFAVAGYVATVVFAGMPVAEAVLLLFLFARTLSALNKAQRKYQAVMVERSALYSVLDKIEAAEAVREPEGGSVEARLEHSVQLRDVTVLYEDRSVLHGLSLELPRGELTAIVGASGVGKTTLVDLVTGLVTPDSGEVRIDDTPLEEIDLRAWRHSIGYVPQETLMLHDTVRNNVTLGEETVDDAAVVRALRDAGAWSFVAALPERLDESIGERGGRLSGGQRQRLAIARALVHEPALLILDEATAALDTESEAEVWATVAALRGKTTVVAISHQPALTRVADSVYSLDKGTATRIDPTAAGSS